MTPKPTFSSFIQIIVLGLILSLAFKDALSVMIGAWVLWNIWLFILELYKAAFGPGNKS